MIHNELKKKVEESLGRTFIKEFNQLRNLNIQFIRLGDANKKEVDCICTNDFNIEVSAAYANQYQAEKVNSYRRGFETKSNPDYLLSTEENLEQIIFDKLDKLNKGNYSGTEGDIYLLIEIHSQMYTDQDILNIVQAYCPFYDEAPFDKFFKEVWTIWLSDNGTMKIAQLE